MEAKSLNRLYVINIQMDAKNIQFTRIEIQIVKHIFRHFNDKYNARQLARILHINHAHTNKLCHNLADKKLLVKEELGNSVFFSYNYDDKLAIKFMQYLISLEISDAPKWLNAIIFNLKKFEGFLKIGLIFGSSIKTKDCNDIDILLMYDAKKAKDIKKIKEGIRKSELIEKPIRYLDIAEKDILANKKDKVFYEIISESLVFYNPEKFVDMVNKCRK